MSNPWAKSFEDLRSPYLQEKKAKKDYDGDGKVESGAKEYRGVIHNKIQKAKGGKADGQDTSSVKEHHQKDADGNVVEHDDEEVSEAKIDKIDPKNKRNRRNVAKFGPQTKPYDPPTKEMKTSMGKFMQKTRQDMHKKKRGVKQEEVVLESDKKGKGSGTKDACYHKVKSRYSVWPSAYASGALVKCRKKGAKNWGNSSKKEEFDFYQMPMKSFEDRLGECWKTHKKVGMKMKGGKMVPDCRPKNEETEVKKESIKITPHDISGGTKAGTDFMSGRTNPKTGKPVYKLSNPGGMRLRLAHYDWEAKMIEAVKNPKLDIKETGVKNKIEINPEIKTEEAKSNGKK